MTEPTAHDLAPFTELLSGMFPAVDCVSMSCRVTKCRGIVNVWYVAAIGDEVMGIRPTPEAAVSAVVAEWDKHEARFRERALAAGFILPIASDDAPIVVEVADGVAP
jgi:hypothetical protein